jgi:uncharacterized protein (TIGR03382 family)
MECHQMMCRFFQTPTIAEGDTCKPGDVCAPGTVCAGPVDGPTVCQRGCDVATDCPAENACEAGAGGVKYCRPVAPPATMSLAKVEGPAASGCSATGVGGALVWLLPLVGLVARRRR